jgi:hypothetical protein
VSEQAWPTSNVPDRERPESLKPLRGHAVAAMVGVALGLIANILVLVATWRAVNAINAYNDGAGTRSEVLAAADFADSLLWPFVGVSVIAGVPFLIWLWRARHNAEFLADVASQRRARGWVIFGWFVPIVSFWFPHQVVSDIWTASRPEPAAAVSPLVNAWWAAFLGSWMIDRVTTNVEDIDVILGISVVSTVLYVIAGVLVYLIVSQITVWQSEPRESA